MNIKAIIFDLDGTVVADEDEYGAAFNNVLRQFGIDTNSLYPHIAGIGVEENWRNFKNKYKFRITKSIEELSRETQEEYLKLLKNVKPKKGFTQFVKDLREKGIKTALATSNSWTMADRILATLNLEDYFDCITTAEEVGYKKPDPQIFEVTLEKLGIATDDCVVFEDSKAGIKAAKELGMKVVAFYRNDKHRENLKRADKIVKDFSEISPSDL